MVYALHPEEVPQETLLKHAETPLHYINVVDAPSAALLALPYEYAEVWEGRQLLSDQARVAPLVVRVVGCDWWRNHIAVSDEELVQGKIIAHLDVPPENLDLYDENIHEIDP